MSRSLLAKLLVTAMVFHASASAGELAEEIDHLIDFVGDSNCTFIRNGNQHSAAEAVEHMQKKYDYFREEVASAEQFIELSASKSLLSGRPYWIACPNREKQHSRTWLLNELARYRLSSKTDS